MNDTTFFEKLAAACALGSLTTSPQPVSGGYLHKMFRLDTTTGSYAVKLLNPDIMKRPGVQANYRCAETLEGVLEQNALPIVAAISLDGQKMQLLDGQYYYLFSWVDAVASPWNGITKQHCSTIGGLLGKMHALSCHEYLPADAASVFPKPFVFDWEGQLAATKEACPALYAPLQENLPLLLQAQSSYNAAIAALPNLLCICNADMDSKNVLWQGDKPLVIDLECLEIGNPINDLMQLSLSWAGGVLCQLDQERLRSFLQAYRQRNPLPTADWQRLVGLGFAWLDWLHYNLLRALGSEGEERQAMGQQEAAATLKRIAYYAEMLPQVAPLFAEELA